MGRIKTYVKKTWDVTSDMGTGRGKEPGYQQDSPADPVTILQCYAQYTGIAGGDGTSKIEITCHQLVDLFGSPTTNIPLQIHEVGDSGGTPVETFNLFTGAGAPSDGLKQLRIGNWDYADARAMRMFAENFEFVVDNPGTAYTAGYVNIIPVGYIVTV
jgi:hypothetical protein